MPFVSYKWHFFIAMKNLFYKSFTCQMHFYSVNSFIV